jgi:hypothetical protein
MAADKYRRQPDNLRREIDPNPIFHCHVNDHFERGMQALFTLRP